MRKKIVQILKIIIYILLLAAVIFVYQTLIKLDNNYVIVTDGAADLTDFDFSQSRARVFAQGWEYYPERLYYPHDFQNGVVMDPIYENNVNSAAYGTYRLTLFLARGVTYGITGRSFLYSTRVYINGELAGEIGSPGNTYETTIPRTNTYAFYFTPQSEHTEIIFLTSNFQMEDGGGSFSFSLGEAGQIEKYRLTRQTGAVIMAGGLITITLLFIGMFIFFTNRRYFLYYALLTLTIALRAMVTGDKPVMEFFPMLDWYVSIRAEYLLLVLIFIFALLFFQRLYPKLIWAPAFYTALGLSVLYAALILFTSPMFFGTLRVYYSALWGVGGLYILIRLALGLKKSDIERALIFTGLLFFFIAAVNDLIQYSLPVYMRFYDALSVGMLLFVHIVMIALTIGFTRTERDLNESRFKGREIALEKTALERVNHLKTDLMRTVSHEMRTPLAVMMGFAELTAEYSRNKSMDEQTAGHLDTIAAEARRMTIMLEELSSPLLVREFSKDMRVISADDFLRQIAGIYEKVLEYKNVCLILALQQNLPPIYANEHELIQVVFNLLRNSDKHTDGGEITVCTVKSDNEIHYTVADTGAGISPELLPHVFERGVSGEKGGMGFGLAICRDIIEAHNGRIWIESEYGKGTSVHFSLPIYAGGDTHAE